MKFKCKISLLAAIIASLGTSYIPQANAATDLGALAAAGANFNDLYVAGGTATFTDLFTFTVGADSKLAGSLTYFFNSDAYSSGATSSPYSTITSGLTLSTVKILEGATVVGTGVFTAAISPVSISSVPLPPPGGFIWDTKSTTIETVTLNNINLLNGKTYTLEIIGSATGEVSSAFGYSGNLAAITTPMAAIPIPAATWLFLSGLIGVLGFSSRRQGLSPKPRIFTISC